MLSLSPPGAGPHISHQSRVIDKGQHCAERSLAIANIMWLWLPVQNHLGARPGGAHRDPSPREAGAGGKVGGEAYRQNGRWGGTGGGEVQEMQGCRECGR